MTGTLASAADALDQALAAARDDHVHVLGHGDQAAHGGTVGGLHQLHASSAAGRPRPAPAAPARPAPGWTAGLRAAAQDAGVAALDGQRGGLDGHVGPALEDHAEHAQRHAHLAHAMPLGWRLHAGDLADRVGHGGELLAALGHGGDDLRRQSQAVDHGRPGRPPAPPPGRAHWPRPARHRPRAGGGPAHAGPGPWPPSMRRPSRWRRGARRRRHGPCRG
jgi:hypothetical protein